MRIFIYSEDTEFLNQLPIWLDLNASDYTLLSDISELQSCTDQSIFLYDTSNTKTNFLNFNLPCQTIAFIEEKTQDALKYMIQYPHIQHFIAKEEESIKLLLYPLKQKIFHPFLYGLERYFSLDSIYSLNIRKYSEKKNCFELVEHALSQSRHFKALKDYSMTVTSELLMNAFFDAPIDKKTNTHLFVNYPKQNDLELPGDYQNVFSCALSPKWFAISVADHFGSLNKSDLIKSLKRASESTGEDQLRTIHGSGGAGIGLYMLYNNTCKIIFKIAPHEKTEVTCFLKMTKHQKEYETRPKSIQFIERVLK